MNNKLLIPYHGSHQVVFIEWENVCLPFIKQIVRKLVQISEKVLRDHFK